MDTETEQKLPEGATYGQPSAAQNASATADKKLPPGAQYGAPTSSERKLPQGARYGEARDNSTDSTSPIPENYGFTPRHMAGAAWEGLGNIASAGLEAGKDVLSYAFSPKPLLISDDKHGESLFHKYITAPAEAEKQKASTAPTALESIGHSVAEAIPVIGPIAAHIAERAGTGDVGGAAAEGITYAVAPKVAEKIVPPIVKGTLKRIPLVNEIPAAIDYVTSAVKERYAPKAAAPEAVRGAAPAEPELIPSRQAAPKAAKPTELGRIEAAIPEAANIISSVEDEAKRFGTTVAPAKPGLKPIRLEPGLVGNDYTEPSTLKPSEQVAEPIVRGVKPAKVEEQLNRGLGNEPLKPGVPLREQNLIPEKPAAEAKLSSEPRKAALQQAGATPEEIETILYKTGSGTGPTKVEMSRLAEHFGVDLGESAIGRGKSDVAAGTHIPQHEVLQLILAEHSPAEVAKAIGEGKQLATVSGASQGYVPIPNASGESAASMEAIGRIASEKTQGLKRIVVDTRSGAERPLIGPDAVDYAPRPYEQVEFRGGNRNGEIIDQGSKARRMGLPRIDQAAGTDISQHEVLQRILKNHSPAEIARAIDEGRHLPTASGGSQAAEDENVPTFYSKAERVANQKVNTGSGDSILSTLHNNGVKESEIQWMGLDDYLKGKPKVSKADVQQFIKDNQIQLEETTKGGSHAERLEQLGAQRNKAFAENNRIWGEKLGHGYARLSTELFNEMAEGGKPESVIAKMPPENQEAARRFVETDQQIHTLDKQLAELSKQASRAKFETYTLPGEKSNYTEKLLTLPAKGEGRVAEINSRLAAISEQPAIEHGRHPEWKDEWDRLASERRQLQSKQQSAFKSSHFDEPNVVAHVRYDDRIAPDGKKTLFLEEVQSDWHQKGKREGYRTDTMKNLASKIDVAQDNYRAAMSRWESLGDKADRVSPEWKDLQGADRQLSEAKLAYNRGQNAVVPDAPFKNDWHELAMKRMLRHAAENGYDRLAWTTGEQQAARYDLSKQVSKLEWHPVIGSGDGKLWAFDHSGNAVMQEQIHPSQIADYVGKDAAQKLLDAPLEQSESGRRQWRSVSGVDLKVGGDWAKNLYDKAIVNFLNKYGKRWGAKVGETDILSGTKDRRVLDTILRQDFGTDWGSANEDQRNQALAIQEGRASAPPTKVHSIDITPAMKKSVMTEGQPIAKVERPRTSGLGRIEIAA